MSRKKKNEENEANKEPIIRDYERVYKSETIQVIHSEFKYDDIELSKAIDFLVPILVALMLDKLLDMDFYMSVGFLITLLLIPLYKIVVKYLGKRNLFVSVKIDENAIPSNKNLAWLLENFDFEESHFPGLCILKYRKSVSRSKAKEFKKDIEKMDKIAEEQEKGIITAIQNLINAKMTKETIIKIGYTEEEYAKAETAFLQPVE